MENVHHYCPFKAGAVMVLLEKTGVKRRPREGLEATQE